MVARISITICGAIKARLGNYHRTGHADSIVTEDRISQTSNRSKGIDSCKWNTQGNRTRIGSTILMPVICRKLCCAYWAKETLGWKEARSLELDFSGGLEVDISGVPNDLLAEV